MAITPKTTAYILSCMSLYYCVSLTFTNFAAKNYGEGNASYDVMKFYQWCAMSFGWTMVPFFCAVKSAGDDDSKIRRVLTFFVYGTCINIGSMNHAGPQHLGGVFVDSEHKINTIMQMAMMYLAGMAISSGPSVHATESLFKMSSPLKMALALHLLAYNFWYLDIGTLSSYDKYYPGFDASDSFAYDAIRWFSASVGIGSFWVVHAMAYGGAAGQKLLCQWTLANHFINEYLIRFTALGDKMPASAMNEGLIMRFVMVGSLALALFNADKKKVA
jgi:hypothetical protein